MALKTSGNESWKKEFPVKVCFLDFGENQLGGDSSGLPGRGLFFFQKKHVPFQKNTHIEVFGVKHIKLEVIFEGDF